MNPQKSNEDFDWTHDDLWLKSNERDRGPSDWTRDDGTNASQDGYSIQEVPNASETGMNCRSKGELTLEECYGNWNEFNLFVSSSHPPPLHTRLPDFYTHVSTSHYCPESI